MDLGEEYKIWQFMRFMAGEREYKSWAPEWWWESGEPGVIEYESWGQRGEVQD